MAESSFNPLCTAFVRNPDVQWTTLDDEAVLVNLETGFYYTLNAVGRSAWELFTKDRTLEEIVERLCKRFDVSKEQASTDLQSIVDELCRERLVEQVSQQARGGA